MEYIAPSGNVYQAGTFSGNPLSLIAGYTTVKFMMENKVIEKVNRMAEELVKGLKDVKTDDVNVDCIASMFCVYFGDVPKNYSDALKLDKERYMRFFWKMLERGVFLPPSQFETSFVSYAHTREDVEKTIEAFELCLRGL